MSKKPIAHLRQDLEEEASTRRAETFEMLNLRPGAKIAAMIELLAELRSAPVSSLLTDALSQKLALYAASDVNHAPAILDAAEAFVAEHGQPSPESALGLLADRGLLKIETDNPLLRQMKIQLAASKKRGESTTREDET